MYKLNDLVEVEVRLKVTLLLWRGRKFHACCHQLGTAWERSVPATFLSRSMHPSLRGPTVSRVSADTNSNRNSISNSELVSTRGAHFSRAAAMSATAPANKGTLNFSRRTWDKDEYSARARDRASAEAAAAASGATASAAAAAGAEAVAVGSSSGVSSGGDGSLVRHEPAPYRNAPAGVAGPAGSSRAYLHARTTEVDLEGKLGKRKLVTEATPVAATGGYWCETCQCTLRDSLGYLDHINGKKHQRRHGVSMRVEKSSLGSVKARLALLAGGSGSAPGARALVTAVAPSTRVHMAPEDEQAMRSMSTRGTGLGAASAASAAIAAAEAAAAARLAAGELDDDDEQDADDDDDDNDDDDDVNDEIAVPAPAKRQRLVDDGSLEVSACAGSTAAATSSDKADAGDVDDVDDEEAAMAAAMGFSSFSTTAKR